MGWNYGLILTLDGVTPSENHRAPPERRHVQADSVRRGPLARARRRASSARDRVRATPGGRLAYRVVVGVVGTAITAGGLLLVPLPGPGWLIVFVGLAILASEFAWAQRLLEFGRERLRRWTGWLARRSVAVRWLVAAATGAFVLAFAYLMLLVSGWRDQVPEGWLPVLPWP